MTVNFEKDDAKHVKGGAVVWLAGAVATPCLLLYVFELNGAQWLRHPINSLPLLGIVWYRLEKFLDLLDEERVGEVKGKDACRSWRWRGHCFSIQELAGSAGLAGLANLAGSAARTGTGMADTRCGQGFDSCHCARLCVCVCV
jgi:hypothetical protein